MPAPAADAARCAWWAEALTRLPSVTGSEDEAAFAAHLVRLLRESPAFADAPQDVWTLPVAGGPHVRHCVLALVGRGGPRSVIVTGHYDTVHARDYGALADLAFSPEPLRAAMLERPPGRDAPPDVVLAFSDLQSGAFLPGRGLLDMKSGLAAGIVALERFAADPQARGHLLLLVVPDEEARSAGARTAAAALPRIAAERGLQFRGVINLDAISDPGDGGAGQVVTLGTVGKLSPFALVIGRPVHAGYAYDGLNAASLAGALAAELEWLPALSERSGAEQTAGFTLLGMRDGKAGYDVTMPASVWMFWNLTLHRRQPPQVLELLQAAATRTARRWRRRLAARHPRAASLPTVPVLLYRELLEGALRSNRTAAGHIAAASAKIGRSGLPAPEQCRLMAEQVWSLSGREGPAIVLGFGSVPYPACSLDDEPRHAGLIAALGQATQAVARRHATGITLARYFRGICDMSFLGDPDVHGLAAVEANTPVWEAVLGEAGLAFAKLPAVNAGPWGRDYHTPLERVHMPYCFGVLPDLIGALARAFLELDTACA